MKTLLITADPAAQQRLSEALKRRKHEVTVVGHSDAACAACRSDDFSLLILDADLPDDDAVQLCRRLRDLVPSGQGVILALGKRGDPEHLQTLLAAGADDYLADPADAALLDVRWAVAEQRMRAAAAGREARGPRLGQPPIKDVTLAYDAPYGAFRSSVEGKLLEVNPALVRILGYDTEAELLALDLAGDVYQDPAARPRLLNKIVDYIEGFEVDWKRKDGRPITVRVFARTVRDESGRPVGFEGIVEDVTEQKRAEERYRHLVEKEKDIIYTLDREGNITFASRAVEAMLGYRPEEVIGKHFRVLIPKELQEKTIADFQSLLKTGEITAETVLLDNKGQPHFVEYTSTVIKEGHNSLGTRGIVRDITQRKQAADLLRIQRDLAIRLGSTAGLTEALDQVLEAALEIDGIDCGAVYLIDGSSGVATLASHKGLSPWFVEANACSNADSPEVRLAMAGRPVYRRQGDATSPPGEASRQAGLRATAILPVQHQGEVFAVLNLASRCQDEIPPGARQGLEGIAAGIGGVVARVRAETALRDSEKKYRTLVEAANDAIFVADAETGIILDVNKKGEMLLGLPADKIIGLHQTQLHPEEERERCAAIFQGQVRSGGITSLDVSVGHSSGRKIPVEISASVTEVGGRKIVQGIFRDVTERKKAADQLRESEARYRLIAENATDFIWTATMHGLSEWIESSEADQSLAEARELLALFQFTYASPSVQRLVGYTPEETRELKLRELLTDASYRVATDVLAEELAAELGPSKDLSRQRTLELQHLAKDGSTVWCEVTTTFLRDEQGRAVGLLGVSRNITQRKKAEAAVRKEQRLLRQLLDLHERDRQLIAYEIHDGIAQHLTGARLNFEAFEGIQAQDPDQAQKLFRTGLWLLSDGVDEARRLISGLRPPVLDEFGVVPAVEYLICENRERKGLDIDFVHEVQFRRLAPPLETAVFRIVQESLSNVSRHSQSEKVRVELIQQGDRVRVSVRDWGVGFDPAKVGKGGFGLQGIRERARLLGGTATIESAPDQGTHVAVELPVVEPPPIPAEP